MRDELRVLSFKNNLDSLIAAIIGASLVFIFTNYHGIGISPDSVSYAGVARNIRLGKGILEFNENPLIIFPAGYPVFLGVLSWFFSSDVLVIAPFINAFLVGLILFINGCIIQRFSRIVYWYKWGILSILPISYCLIDVFTMLWSETLFLLWLSFFILSIRRYLKHPTIKALLFPALFTALACDTRIAGLSIMGTGLLLIFLHKRVKWSLKLLHLVIYATSGITLLLLNLVRNDRINGTMTGVRQKSVTPFWLNLQYFGETVLQWFRISSANHILCISLATILLIGVSIILLYRYYKLDKIASFETINIAFCIVYILFILLTSTISRYEKINNRLLSPAFIPLLISISFFLPSLIKSIKIKFLKVLVIISMMFIFLALQFHQVMATIEFQQQTKDAGIPGYTELDWQESDIVQFLKTKPNYFKPDVEIYSNACDAVYFYSGLPALRIPEPVHKVDLKEYYETDGNYIVWFTNDFYNPAIMPINELRKCREIDTLTKFNDAIIFWSKPKMAVSNSAQGIQKH